MRVVIAIAAVSLALASDAFACSCVRPNLVRDLPHADGAFVGTVLERRVERQTAIYLFRVEQVYKGEIENRVEVVTPAYGAACGLEVTVGQRIGLLLTRGGGEWRSGLCSQIDPSAFLALTNVQDESPPINWGGIVVGALVLGAGAFFLVRKLRYKALR
ncbi:MAG: hypothetical protein QOF45_2498 [Gaiellaceae bacterium]|nr:hypothetical protein [Gaiellaceae bacterium]